MKTKCELFQLRHHCALALSIGSSFSLAVAAEDSAPAAPPNTSQAIPWSQVGTKAGADYRDDGLAVTPTADGARLRCVFQRLECEATREGLWLTSTATNAVNDRFRIVAIAVERESSWSSIRTIPNIGTVSLDGQTVRFTRPGLLEEYTVSVDGVRQDFVVLQRPPGEGELAMRLALSGVPLRGVEPAAGGARLLLENSGRKIAYSRLRVTDARGKELPAEIEVSQPKIKNPKSKMDSALVVLVNDTDAAYPIRIDPTFSDANWISMGGFPGTDGQVIAAVADGSGNLYIGGSFTIVGDVFATNIVKWNGSSWSLLGLGMNGPVHALAISGSDLYAGGSFTSAGGVAATNIAKWDGSSWSALGSGIGGVAFFAAPAVVYALVVSGSDLYAGGLFTTAGGAPARNIVKWNGSSWSALGAGIGGLFGSPPEAVCALAVSGSDLYAGGYFTKAGGDPANNVAKWDGSGWTALGSGISGTGTFDQPGVVSALAVSGGELYAGGAFTNVGGVSANYVAKWDGISWSALGSGLNGAVSALAVSGGDVYAGATYAGAAQVAKWDGSIWTSLASTLGRGSARALAMSGNDLYAGLGWVSSGVSVGSGGSVAKWNGSSWTNLTSGWNGSVHALAASGSDVYAGGVFTTAGGAAALNVAKWNGSSWSALGSGIGGNDPHATVLALAVSGSDVYVGGSFTRAGGNAADYIAKWNGSTWSALGSGLNGAVSALALSGSDLYAGGYFTEAGGNPATNIAKWNGSSWSALGAGIAGPSYPYYNPLVSALAASGSEVYAGGQFTTAGGSAANYIAKWNGSSWSALGSGLNGAVSALAVSGGDVYAGGSFTEAGGNSATNIAKWNGSSWSALGQGLGVDEYYGNPAPVSALVASGSDLYAGGTFGNAGGFTATYIAKWNGSTWTALGSGIGPYSPNTYIGVYALSVSGSDLYVGGYFTTAGGKVSPSVARAIVNPPVLAIQGDGFGGYFLSFEGVPGSAYRLQRAPSLTGPWATSSPQTAPGSGLLEFWDLFPPPGQGFYRSMQP